MMIVSMVLFWALIIAGIALAVRYTRRDAPRTDHLTTAEGLLAERFARGDIDEDEFRSRMATIKSHARH